MAGEENLATLVAALRNNATGPVAEERLWDIFRRVLQPVALINLLSETLRVPQADVKMLLDDHGFEDLVSQAELITYESSHGDGTKAPVQVSQAPAESPFPDLFSIEFSPTPHTALEISAGVAGLYEKLVAVGRASIEGDPFLALYRSDVLDYRERFMATDAQEIAKYLERNFEGGTPKYLINSGIGANEQFNHLAARLSNLRPDKRCTWLVMNSPRQLTKLPADASVENTLFMEFSRSGKTEETVKIHEYTSREAKRIVFANSGPLREIGKRDGNLILDLPDEVSGRFGRNKTPILLAPMFVCGLDTKAFWQDIAAAIEAFDVTSESSLAMVIARFICLHQLAHDINHIYVGCNDDGYLMAVDELTQYWNEGVNKVNSLGKRNDIMMSRYLGLPRDSHMTLEGVLANGATKMGLFVLRGYAPAANLHPLVLEEIDAIDPNHAGLRFGHEECILAEANYRRFCEKMPAIKIVLHGGPTLRHAAIISQLWADLTYCYSRLKSIDPGSNPEVRFVRDRSAKLLAEGAAEQRRA
ncbi:MAG TPA: hypothetical protein PLO37_23080 [Candidatus Hydrogenedentes bacterium]|nr:hypothetical protein [Candidatus Hydrogenedentota bacterium]HPG69743.1 hypothetical protein [Candidatus Hydrogenedentota bacterium]